MQLAAHDDTAGRERDLFTNLGLQVPARLFQGRVDELAADVTFGEVFDVHRAGCRPLRCTARFRCHSMPHPVHP